MGKGDLTTDHCPSPPFAKPARHRSRSGESGGRFGIFNFVRKLKMQTKRIFTPPALLNLFFLYLTGVKPFWLLFNWG